MKPFLTFVGPTFASRIVCSQSSGQPITVYSSNASQLLSRGFLPDTTTAVIWDALREGRVGQEPWRVLQCPYIIVAEGWVLYMMVILSATVHLS